MKENDYCQLNKTTNVLLVSTPIEGNHFFHLFIERNKQSYKIPIANNEYCVKIVSAENSNKACALLHKYEGKNTDTIKSNQIISMILPSKNTNLETVVVNTVIESNNIPDEKLAVSNIKKISADGKYLFFTGGIRKTIDENDAGNSQAFKMEWDTYRYDFETKKIEKELTPINP